MKTPGCVGVAVLAPCLLIAACATPQNPDELRAPAMLTCINLPAEMSFRGVRGLMKVTWEWRLERGPYIAEKEDAQGTYYRAPPGGMFAGRLDALDRAPGPLSHWTSDGGFWMPRDPTLPPRLYTYISTDEAPKIVPAETETCSSLVVLRDPATSKVSVVTFATAGALGGAAAPMLMPASTISSAQGAAGGALGMAFVAALINADVGKIMFKPIDDEAVIAKLRALAAQATPVKEGLAKPSH